ncbi:MAG: hypothetical protein IPH60_15015 [Flavobacteriales bacterium]|nr:hypothetical protein [Flavobacteriales bacterium]
MSVPTVLGNGYLLDNRGVGLNTVFLKWSYAEYASLNKHRHLRSWLMVLRSAIHSKRCTTAGYA